MRRDGGRPATAASPARPARSASVGAALLAASSPYRTRGSAQASPAATRGRLGYLTPAEVRVCCAALVCCLVDCGPSADPGSECTSVLYTRWAEPRSFRLAAAAGASRKRRRARTAAPRVTRRAPDSAPRSTLRRAQLRTPRGCAERSAERDHVPALSPRGGCGTAGGDALRAAGGGRRSCRGGFAAGGARGRHGRARAVAGVRGAGCVSRLHIKKRAPSRLSPPLRPSQEYTVECRRHLVRRLTAQRRSVAAEIEREMAVATALARKAEGMPAVELSLIHI